jgi:hypothetical protein
VRIFRVRLKLSLSLFIAFWETVGFNIVCVSVFRQEPLCIFMTSVHKLEAQFKRHLCIEKHWKADAVVVVVAPLSEAIGRHMRFIRGGLWLGVGSFFWKVR